MRLNKELLAAFVAIRGDGRVSIPLGYFGNLCPAVVAMEISTIVLLRVHCNRFSHTPKCTFFSFLQRNTTRLHFALAQGLSLDFRVACGSIIFTLDRHKCFFLIPQFSSQIWQLFPRVLFVPTVFGKVSSSLSAFRAWIFSTTCQYYSSLSARGRPASLSFYNEKGHNFLLDPTALSLLELGLRLRRFHSSSADREAKSTTWPVIFQSIDYFDTLTSTFALPQGPRETMLNDIKVLSIFVSSSGSAPFHHHCPFAHSRGISTRIYRTFAPLRISIATTFHHAWITHQDRLTIETLRLSQIGTISTKQARRKDASGRNVRSYAPVEQTAKQWIRVRSWMKKKRL